jgi:hypothetical protein
VLTGTASERFIPPTGKAVGLPPKRKVVACQPPGGQVFSRL